MLSSLDIPLFPEIKKYQEEIRLYEEIFLNRLLAEIKVSGLDIDLEKDLLFSAYSCFGFLLSLNIIFQCKEKHCKAVIKKALSFTMLYCIIDHVLDNKNTSNENRKALKVDIKSKLSDSNYRSTIPLHNKLFEYYDNIVTEDKHRSIFKDLYNVTMECYELQKSSKHSLDKYKEICRRKGGITVFAAIECVYEKTVLTKDAYQLGYCIQLLDDCIDCKKDISAGIFTYVTKIYDRKGNCDRCIKELRRAINKLPEYFSVYKTGLSLAVKCLVTRSSRYSMKYRVKYGIDLSQLGDITIAKCEASLRQYYVK